MKLDFKKAYDTVSIPFLFQVMKKMEVPKAFLAMIRPLFADALASILLNSGKTPTFSIGRRVRQGCLLAPYLFLFISEALNAATQAVQDSGALQGIDLPEGGGQQLMIPFVNDTGYTLKGIEENRINIIQLLLLFRLAFRLEINWLNNFAYWISNNPPPHWLRNLSCPWVVVGNLFRLFGTPFGLELNTVDVDEFLYQKVKKKLNY